MKGRLVRCLVVGALLSACRYGYDRLGATGDAGTPADAATLDAAVDDAAVDDAAPPDAGCDPATLLADDFTTLDPRWDAFAEPSGGGATTAIVGGRLRVTLPGSGAGSLYAGFISRGAYRLTGHRLSIEVPTMVDTSTHAQVLWQLKHEEGAEVYQAGFEQQNGTLRMFNDGATLTANLSLAYDAVQHRYWQVRESGGQLFFETSPNGAAWSLQFTSDVDFDVASLRIVMNAGRYQEEIDPGFAEFDHLGGDVPVGTACKR